MHIAQCFTLHNVHFIHCVMFLYYAIIWVWAYYARKEGETMTYSENKKKYNEQYTKEHYKRISLVMQNEEYNTMKEHTESTGETVNGFIKRAILQTIERDKSAPK